MTSGIKNRPYYPVWAFPSRKMEQGILVKKDAPVEQGTSFMEKWQKIKNLKRPIPISQGILNDWGYLTNTFLSYHPVQEVQG